MLCCRWYSEKLKRIQFLPPLVMLLLRSVLHINSYLHLRLLLNMLSFSFLFYSSFPGFAFLCFSSYLSLLLAFFSLTFAWFSLFCFAFHFCCRCFCALFCFSSFVLFCFSFVLIIIIIITHKTKQTKQNITIILSRGL